MSNAFTLTREVLSHHLTTLTNRNDENTFEYFARKLAEAAICPNLTPNTGPSGGGDAKVDTETYPVSQEVAHRWYHGEQSAANERWGFAISAKKEWLSKIKSDVAGIVATGRGYSKIFFITNQPVRAKERAKTEEVLQAKHGVRITILDVNWILEQVFDQHRIALAVRALKLTSEYEKPTQGFGATDFERNQELLKLDGQIGDASRYQGIPSALAEDMLDAALLARGLGRSKQEIDGRFIAAQRAAAAAHNSVLQFRIVYHWAWTSYFWFNDFISLPNLFDQAAALIDGNLDASIVGKLSNLWPLLRASVASGNLAPEVAKLDQRGPLLKQALLIIADNDARPNNAIEARCSLLLMEIVDRRSEQPQNFELDDIFERFIELLRESRKYGTFPVHQFTDALREVGEFTDSIKYDALIETIADELSKRLRDGESAKVNVERGHQKLDSGKPNEAIRWFGRAINGLLKKEYERELHLALAGLAEAYSRIGLSWAARSCALAVVSHQTTENLKKHGTIDGVSAPMFSALFSIELQLGRLTQATVFHTLEMVVRRNNVKVEYEKEELENHRHCNSMLIGSLLLRTPFEHLHELERLPDVFERYGLPEAAFSAYFMLGHLEKTRLDGQGSPEEQDRNLEHAMLNLRKEGAFHDVSDCIVFGHVKRVTLCARVLGAELRFDSSAELHSVSIGEALLGAIESFVANSLPSGAMRVVERLLIRIDADDKHDGPPALKFHSGDGTEEGQILHRPDFGTSSQKVISDFNHFCLEALAGIVGRLIVPTERERFFDELEESNALNRALTFCHVPLMTENVFGSPEPMTMRLFDQPEFSTYSSRRTELWPMDDAVALSVEPQQEKYGARTEVPHYDQISHRSFQVDPSIDVATWNSAKWDGAVFLTGEAGFSVIPTLGFAFINDAAATSIFEGLRRKYGEAKDENELRVAVIRGISEKNPNAYAVTISISISAEGKAGSLPTYMMMFKRLHPKSSLNLDRFLAAYEEFGLYDLSPFHLSSKSSTPRQIGPSLRLTKLVVKDAWQLGEHDQDSPVLIEDDFPLIPEGIENAPVLTAMEKLRKIRGE